MSQKNPIEDLRFTPTLIMPLKLLSLNCKPSYSFENWKMPIRRKLQILINLLHPSIVKLQQYPEDVLQKKIKKKSPKSNWGSAALLKR